MSDPKNVGELVDWLTARPGEPFWFAERGDRLLIGVQTEVGEVMVWNCQIKNRRNVLAAPSPSPSSAPRGRLPSGRLAEPDALREIRRRYTGHGVIHALAALLDAANSLAPEDDPDKYDGWRRLVASARAEYDELWKVAASPQGERERALEEALRECHRALMRARHTGHNLINIKDYWTRYARPAADRAEAVLAASSPHYAENPQSTKE